jgi:hypothetical protein
MPAIISGFFTLFDGELLYERQRYFYPEKTYVCSYQTSLSVDRTNIRSVCVFVCMFGQPYQLNIWMPNSIVRLKVSGRWIAFQCIIFLEISLFFTWFRFFTRLTEQHLINNEQQQSTFMSVMFFFFFMCLCFARSALPLDLDSYIPTHWHQIILLSKRDVRWKLLGSQT